MLQGRFGDGGRGVAPARGERKDVGDLEGREVDGDGPTTTPLLRRGDRKRVTCAWITTTHKFTVIAINCTPQYTLASMRNM